MSVVTRAVWEASLKGTAKLVALYFAEWADDDGRNANPTISNAADETGLSIRCVQSNLRLLQKLGVLLVQCEHDPAEQAPTTYAFDIERLRNLARRTA